VLLEQLAGGHDLAGLAVAALGHVELLPRLLQRMHRVRIEAFDGGDLLAADARDRGQAGARRGAVDVHGAGAALAHAAAVLGADQAERVAQGPQQRRVGFDVDRLLFPVDVQGVFTHG
jgi:hypothetical protein